MRRQDKALGAGVAEMLLESGEYGILSTVGEDGWPYGVPLSFVYSGGLIYIHSAKEGHKVSNIERNDRVSFCVVGFTQVQPKDFTISFTSAIAFGRAHKAEGDEKRRALQAIAAKYTDRSAQDIDDFIASEGDKTVVFGIRIETMTAKGNLLLIKGKAPSGA
jgi:hypothetical protein